MGLIKAAILTGGGVYIVDKLAKAAEHRSRKHPASPPQNPQHPHAYMPPQGPPFSAQGAGYSDNQQQQQQQRERASAPTHASQGPRSARGYPGADAPPAYDQEPRGYGTGLDDSVAGSGRDFVVGKR